MTYVVKSYRSSSNLTDALVQPVVYASSPLTRNVNCLHVSYLLYGNRIGSGALSAEGFGVLRIQVGGSICVSRPSLLFFFPFV
jgi:hypothetical protein